MTYEAYCKLPGGKRLGILAKEKTHTERGREPLSSEAEQHFTGTIVPATIIKKGHRNPDHSTKHILMTQKECTRTFPGYTYLNYSENNAMECVLLLPFEALLRMVSIVRYY